MIRKILILEDSNERIKKFQENLSNFQLEIVKEVFYAINYLNNELWDILFLDHDLGGSIHVPTDDQNTGAEVARWLVNHTEKKPRFIIIHSLNTVGQKYMKHLLPEAVILPMAWMLLTNQNLTEENIFELERLAIKQTRDLYL